MEERTDLWFYPDKSFCRQAPSNIHSLEIYGRWRKSRSQAFKESRMQEPDVQKNLKPNALICRALSGKYYLCTTISCVSEADLLLYAGMTLTVVPRAAPGR